MKAKLVIILTLLNVSYSFCELGSKFYGQGVFKQMLKSPDGNIYILGEKGNDKFWLIKMDQNLNILWEKFFSGNSGDLFVKANHLLITNSGDLIITGGSSKEEYSYYYKGYVLKVNNSGELMWSRQITESTQLFYCFEDKNSQLIFGGIGDQPGSSTNGLILITDSNAHVIANKEVIVYNQTFVKYIDRNKDGNLVLIGRTNVIGAGFEGLFFMEMDNNLNVLNQSLYDMYGMREEAILNSNEHPNLAVYKNLNENYNLFHPYQYNSDIIALELNRSGEKVNSKIFGDVSHSEKPLNFSQLTNGDVLVTGVSNSFIGMGARFSNSLAKKWIKFYSADTINSKLFCCVELDNGNLLMGGEAKVDHQAWLLQTDSVGNSLPFNLKGHVYFDLNNNCKYDIGDFPLNNVSIRNKDLSYYSTTKDGSFTLKTDQITNQLSIDFLDDYYSVCTNPLPIIVNTSTSEGIGDFLIQAKDDCAHLTVQLTQPDLVRCNTSRYIATIKNHGIAASDPNDLILYYDELLSVANTIPAGNISPNQLKFSVPILNPFEEKTYLIDLNLNCKAFLGQGHTVIAKIIPTTCGTSWNGPELAIDKICLGDEAQFIIKNFGKGDMSQQASYRIYINQFLLETESFQLKSGDKMTLRVPSKGKTLFIEVLDENKIFPPDDYYFASYESCGLNPIGMINTGYVNAFRSKNGNVQQSLSSAYNTIGVPNRVKEMNEGLSYYHFTDNRTWSEFTIRVRNPKNKNINNVTLDINITPTLDITSFQLVSGEGQINILDSLNLSIQINQLNLAPISDSINSNLYIKFKIRQKENIIPESGQNSYLGIEASAYFNGDGPFAVIRGWHNLSDTYRETLDSSLIYPSEIQTIGGESYDFGQKILQSKDGVKYLLISSGSFNQGQSDLPYIVKLNSQGKMEWEKVFTLDKGFYYNLKTGAVTESGDLIIICDQIPNGEEYYIHNTKMLVAKISPEGTVLWSNSFNPGLNGYGGVTNDVILSKDNFIVATGISATNSINSVDNFLIKINQMGDLLWIKNYVAEGLAFEPSNLFENLNGEFIMAGSDDSRQLIIAQKSGSTGDKIWIKTFTPQVNTASIYNVSAVLTKEEEIIFGGYSQYEDKNSGEYIATPHFIKLTKNGNYLNEKTPIVGKFNYSQCDKIILSPDNKIILLGKLVVDTTSNNYHDNLMIAKFDLDFNELWKKDFDIRTYVTFHDAIFDQTGNISLIGYDQGVGHDNNLQTVYFQTDAEGKLLSNNHIPKEAVDAIIYPNPASEHLNLFMFSSFQKKMYYEILNTEGKLMSREPITNQKSLIDVNNFPNGIYFLRILPESKTLKFIVYH